MVDLVALRETLDGLEALDYRLTYQKLYDFKPHVKQWEHINKGRDKRERLLMANNRGGKTLTGAFEAACHMTGEYPEGWNGRRFAEPTMGWITGETSLLVRDIQQGKLCGPPGVESMFGTGMIPKEMFVDRPSLARGVTDAYDTIQVRHKSGGISIGKFKSYEQGRQKFQGEGLDWIWFDEEPPIDIYGEGVARIGERDGISWLTFTPLKGRSEVVLRFLDEPSPDRAFTVMTLDDAHHIPPEVRKKMEAGYLPHEREARARGVPTLGSGRIFTASEEAVVEEPIQFIPPFWKKLWGSDFGIDHPFGAVLILWDVDADVIHVHHTYRITDALPIQHADAMKRVGAEVPVAWPVDGNVRRDDGKPMADHYKRHGLKMLPSHATWPDGSVSTEAGILEMDEREKSGRLKYARQLSDILEERRFYHRKDGQIVKLKDDLISALRTAIMAKREARAVQLGGKAATAAKASTGFARGTSGHPDGEFDILTGA
jgi:phage terminase large subunit-like protein